MRAVDAFRPRHRPRAARAARERFRVSFRVPPLDYAAPTASIARGAPLTFAVRTAAPAGSVVVRVSGADDVDADGLLTGPEGTWLDETATQALADLQVWSVPDDSVLRQRPGHYYWQAYLTGDAANGASSRSAPCSELDRHASRRRPRPRQASSRASAPKGIDELLPVLERASR